MLLVLSLTKQLPEISLHICIKIWKVLGRMHVFEGLYFVAEENATLFAGFLLH